MSKQKRTITDSDQSADPRAVDQIKIKAYYESYFEKIGRLIEYRKGLIIRQYNGGLGFELVVRYLAREAFGADIEYGDAGAALAAVNKVRLETIIKIDSRDDLDRYILNEKLKAEAARLEGLPFFVSIGRLEMENLIMEADRIYPDRKKYLISDDGIIICGSEGYVLRLALEYRGALFSNSFEYQARYPENLYMLLIDKGGYYSFGHAKCIFPSIVLRPEPALIGDPVKRRLHLTINDFIMEKTGCPAFLLGEKLFMGPEWLNETADMALNEVYVNMRDFLREGFRKITSYDRLMIELRKRIANDFELPAILNL